MEHLPFPDDVARVGVAGDWHGDRHFAAKIVRHFAAKIDVVVHTGDFLNIYAPDAFLDDVEEIAQEAKVIIMFVDGNHEPFDWLLAHPVDEDGVRRLRPRVWHLPRGFRWEWMTLTFLALGGAHSVDRPMLTPGRNWWPQETITLQEAADAAGGGHADVMVTHDCPAGVDGLDLSGGEKYFPVEELERARRHRQVLTTVVHEVKPHRLWHGHHHYRYDGRLDYGDGTYCQVMGLAPNRARIYADNMQVIDLWELL